MNERTFDDFDEFAKNYRSVHTKNLLRSGADSLYFAEHKVLQIKKTESPGEKRLLDVGCGDGASEVFFQQNFPSWKLYGIDTSTESISLAKERNISSAQFQCYNGTVIPFEDESFDIVFIAAVLHHIDFSLHFTIMKEMHRVLKTSGRIYLFEHNPLNPFTRYLVRTCPFDSDARLLSYQYTKKLLRAIPFSSINKSFTLFFPRKGVLAKLVRLEDKLKWLPIGGQYFYRATKC